MKFNLPTPCPTPDLDATLRIGNIYACKGGGKTSFWIVIGLTERTVNLIGINRDGVITSTANYGAHVFDFKYTGFGRELLGHCDGLDALDFDITWVDRP
jgi:hypothetical protein